MFGKDAKSTRDDSAEEVAPGPTRTIRSATLIGYTQAATAVGLDPIAMLRVAQLDPACMDDWETRISLDAYLKLLVLSASQARCGDFGARAALARGLPDYGLVSLVMREAETVEAALQVYTDLLSLHSDGIHIELDKRSGEPFINMELFGRTAAETVQATQFCMVGVTRQLRWLTGGLFWPKLVCFDFPRPVTVFPPVRYVDCEIVYNQTASGIVVQPEVLRRLLVTSEPNLRRIALRQLGPATAAAPGEFTMQVSRAVRLLLSEGSCSSDAVAAQFRIDRRTLNRRLERECTCYSLLVQQVRVEMTLRALNDPRCSITEIADLIGFESLSSFLRWFQASLGCRASDWAHTGRRQPDLGWAAPCKARAQA